MAYLNKKSAEQFMRLIIHYPESAKKMSADTKWKYLYELHPKNYMDAFAKYFSLLQSEPEDKVFNLVYRDLSK